MSQPPPMNLIARIGWISQSDGHNLPAGATIQDGFGYLAPCWQVISLAGRTRRMVLSTGMVAVWLKDPAQG